MGDVGIGIDFGTSFSCVAVCRDGKVEVIANEHDKRLTPSYVAFTEEERLYGDAARHQNPLNLKNTFYQSKMLLGRTYDEISKEAFFGYDIEASESKLKLPIIYKGEMKSLSPEQVSAMVIGKMKKDAEIYLETEVKRAVISVPASFNHAQRKATIDAGKIAGFETVELINGTTAAAIAYGLDREKDQERNVLILDFGGGKFDVSIVKIHKRNFQVMGAYGDSSFGGEDFDNNLVRYFTKDKSNFNDKKAICRLQEACEKAKRTLSGAMRARIRVDSLFDGKPYSSEITRSDFEDINEVYFDRAMEIVEKSVKFGKVKKSEITELVLVGGSTRIPKFRQLIQEYFNGMELSRTINPDEAVACGAAFHCASEMIYGYTMVDVASIPIVIKGGANIRTLVDARTSLPSATKLTAKSGSQWQVFEGEPVDSTKDSVFTVQADPMTETKFCWKVDVNGLVNVTTSVNEEKGKPNIISRNKRNVAEDAIQEMLKQHAKFQMDDDLIAQASDKRNDLEKYAYSIKQAAKSPEYNDKLDKNIKEKITSECNNVLEWLNENQNASVVECTTREKELDRIYHPLFKIKQEEQAKNLEMQKKKEEENKLCQKAMNDLKILINDADSKAKSERFKVAPEKPIILKNCKQFRQWVEDNQGATKEVINATLTNFQKWIESTFEKMEQKLKTINLEQQKIEEKERKLCQKAQNKLKNFIENIESKAKLQCYEFAKEKPEILQNCQKLRKCLEDNQNATINDIIVNSQKVRKCIEDTFEKMEQAVKAATKKERQLMSESKQKLEECLVEINKSASDPKYADYLVDKEKEILNKYCAEANALLNKSNPSKTEFDERRKALEKNCYPIFAQINNKIQAIENEKKEMKLQNDLTSLEIFSTKVLDVTSEFVLANKISSNEGKRIITMCNKILELIKNGEIKTMESCETYHGNIDEVYQPIKKLEKQQNMEAEKNLLSFVDNVKSSTVRIQGSDDYKVSVIHKCDEITGWISLNKEANENDYNSRKEELKKVAQPMFDMLDREKKQAERDLVSFVEHVKSSAAQIQGSDDYKDSVLNKCDEITMWISSKKEANKNDYDSKMRELQHSSQSLLGQLDQQKKQEIKEARRTLQKYANESKKYLLNPANKQRLSSATHTTLINNCDGVLLWTSINKTPELTDCVKKKQHFDHICVEVLNEMKRQDKMFYEKLSILSQVVDKDIVTVKDKDENYEKLKNEFDEVKEWISANKMAFKPEYETKIRDLNEIQRNVSDKLSEQEKMESMRYKEERVQQRSARQAFRNHVSEVHKYLNSVTENRILPEKKRAYLDQCTEELMWKSDDQTSESTEFEKRHENFNNTIGTVFDKLRQEDKNAQQELRGLYKDVKSMIDSTGSDELVDKDKLQSECSDIIDWIFKHPNAYKADYENQQNKLETIKNQYQDQLQQRNKDLQSDFFNYLKQIKHYVEDKSYSELVHSDEKATLLREYSIGYLWIENQKKVKYSELVEKKKNLVHVCQPIFDRLMRAEFNRTKKTLEDYVHQVEQKVRFEYSTRLNENDKRVIQGKCENVRQFRKKNKNANTEELKTVYFDLTSAVEPILKKLRETYENNESKRQRHPSTTNTKVITQQPRNEQSTPENDNRQYSEGNGYQDVKKKTTRLISPDQTFSKPERDRDSSRLAIAGNRVRCFPVSDKHKYGAHTQSQKTSRGDEYHYFPSNSQMQSQGEFQTLDETSRPYSGRLHSSSSKSGKNTPIAEAKANLSVYVKEIINDLDNDASRGFFLSTNHRNQLYGSCVEVRNWLKETKNPSLEEIERKTQQLKTKYRASGLRSNRLVQSDWL